LKWRKLGKIFDPTSHELPNNCKEFAQAPQALVFDDFVRIYFSTRERDKLGKYLSHVAFVEMDKGLKHIIRVSSEPVIGLGNLGCYDEHGIFPFNILRDGDRVLGYIGGWNRRVSVSVDGSIGLAISNDDGLSFRRIGDGPILSSSLHEPFLVGDPFVTKFNKVYHMWYIFGTKWIDGVEEGLKERVYKIGHAVSNDGISWRREGRRLISDRIHADECQALPTVFYFGGRYHMYFCYRRPTEFRNNPEMAYRLGYASSEDLTIWTRDDEHSGIDSSRDSWDAEMMCYPHAFHCGNQTYLLYNGNEFGRLGFGIAILDDSAS
jgi:hypothetical protein